MAHRWYIASNESRRAGKQADRGEVVGRASASCSWQQGRFDESLRCAMLDELGVAPDDAAQMLFRRTAVRLGTSLVD